MEHRLSGAFINQTKLGFSHRGKLHSSQSYRSLGIASISASTLLHRSQTVG